MSRLTYQDFSEQFKLDMKNAIIETVNNNEPLLPFLMRMKECNHTSIPDIIRCYHKATEEEVNLGRSILVLNVTKLNKLFAEYENRPNDFNIEKALMLSQYNGKINDLLKGTDVFILNFKDNISFLNILTTDKEYYFEVNSDPKVDLARIFVPKEKYTLDWLRRFSIWSEIVPSHILKTATDIVYDRFRRGVNF